MKKNNVKYKKMDEDEKKLNRLQYIFHKLKEKKDKQQVKRIEFSNKGIEKNITTTKNNNIHYTLSIESNDDHNFMTNIHKGNQPKKKK